MTLSQLHHFFDNFSLPRLPSEYNNPLGGEISNSETIKSLKCSKTPGPDRQLYIRFLQEIWMRIMPTVTSHVQ